MNATLGSIAPYVDRRELTALLMIAVLAALVVLLYADSFASMTAVWQSSDYRHGLLVFPVSACLLWRIRKPLAATELRPCAGGLLLLVPGVLLWSIARAIGVQTAEHLVAVLLIPATVLTFAGWPLVRQALFPLLFLVTAVPVGDALIPYLMEITADVATALLQVVGVPVYRQGQFLSLPGGEFEVADVCSGVRYLTAGTMIALLFGYLSYESNAKRALFVAATAVTMVVVNGVRAFLVMWIASASDMRYLAGRDHILFGWLLFAVVIAATIYIGAQLSDPHRDEPVHELAAAPRKGRLPLVLVLGFVMLAATSQPLREGWSETWLLLVPAGGLLLLWALYRRFESLPADAGSVATPASGYWKLNGILALAVAAIVLTAGPLLLTGRASAVSSTAPGMASMSLPMIAGCGAPGAWAPSWQPELRSPDIVLAGTYSCEGEPIDVSVAAYFENEQGRELITHANRLMPADWRRFSVAGTHGFIAHGETVEVNEVELTTPLEPAIVWYWYAVGGETATTPSAVKLLQSLQLLRHGRADGSVYLLVTPLDESLEASRRRLAVAGEQLVALVSPSRERGRQ
jgi:exosortase A